MPRTILRQVLNLLNLSNGNFFVSSDVKPEWSKICYLQSNCFYRDGKVTQATNRREKIWISKILFAHVLPSLAVILSWILFKCGFLFRWMFRMKCRSSFFCCLLLTKWMFFIKGMFLKYHTTAYACIQWCCNFLELL